MDKSTIRRWETGRGGIQLGFIPKVLKFIGHTPDESGDRSFGERIMLWRENRGISQMALARSLGIDTGTLSRLERGKGVCSELILKKIRTAIDFI